jgi:hypothetical protein
MKKLLFIALTVAGFTNLASAQKKKAPATLTQAPTQAEVARDSKVKLQAEAKSTAPVKKTRAVAAVKNDYKNTGLSETQIKTISGDMANLDKKRDEINANSQLTPQQKTDALAAIEAERRAIINQAGGKMKMPSAKGNEKVKQVKP